MPSMPNKRRTMEYLTMVAKLWGSHISGPILALVAIAAVFINARYANDATATAVAAKYVAWITGGLSGFLIFVAQYQTWSGETDKYKSATEKLEKIENARPRLILKEPNPISCKPVTQTFWNTETHQIVKQRIDNFLGVRFINDPELSVPSSRAIGVTAKIYFYRIDETVPMLCLDGRWAESTQPSAIPQLETKFDLLPATFLQGQERTLDIAFCNSETGQYYAWNNDNYNAANELFVYPPHLLQGERFRVEIRLRGDWIDKRISFTFSAKDRGFVIESYAEEGISRGAASN
jgi:hypothetical protein